MHHDNFAFSISQITKIEGHAKLDVVVKDDKVTTCRFLIADFKRFYTKAVEHKPAVAAPSFLSRICGTCSTSHILASLKAIESALGVEVTPATKVRRELTNAGLYIRDHALHLIVFILPDVYQLNSIVDFDETDPAQRAMIENLFKLKAAGNHLAIFAAGRAVHAPDMIFGGFSKPVEPALIPSLIEELTVVRPIALQLVDLFTKVNFTLIRNNHFLAMRGTDHYDYIFAHRFKNQEGTEYQDTAYRAHLQHVSVPYSHASGYRFEGEDFMVGSLARLNLNQDLLHPNTQRDAVKALELFPSNNVHHNNLAQAIEIVDSIDYALDLLQRGPFDYAPAVTPSRTSGTGIGLVEAPRGALYHSAVVTDGQIAHYEVIVPTGQNQINIENDLRLLIEAKLDLPEADLKYECEKLIRAYDPCMSCASHFLKMKLQRP